MLNLYFCPLRYHSILNLNVCGHFTYEVKVASFAVEKNLHGF